MAEIGALTRQKPREALIDLGDGDSVRIVFDSNRVTPLWVDETQKRVNNQDSLSLPKALSDVILEWDVTDEGAPFPPSAENIAKLSFPVMGLFFERIMDAAVPSSEEGNASSDISSSPSQSSTPPPVNLQNGPAPSTSPLSSASPSPT